ncbi:MAG: 5'-3' exonuclease H3TH domain-containing protein, partial [bacterium]|nr:5'-3' exonuclease H3TH domain-containing protein [bacterium]
MNGPLILIDASSYFFRAFHALPPLTNSKGQPTGAIYGVANMIKKLIKDYKPQNLAVVFDAKGKTFRDDWYPEYKAHRPAMPTDLSSQFEPLVQLLKAMGLPLLIIEGVEADDVIGTLAYQATQLGRPVVISTGDKDMAQLVNEHVSLINTMSNYVMDIPGVQEKFGVRPDQIIDYLTLVGDSVDNIPGVTKCGPKTAAKWLEEHQTLDNIIANAHSVSGKIGEYLRASLAHLPLSKKLITIKTDVELPLTLDELSINAVNKELLIELTRELEFKNWLKELLEHKELAVAEVISPEASKATNCELITCQEQLDVWLTKLGQASIFCIDTETTALDFMVAQIVGISFAVVAGTGVYIPLTHKDGSPQLNREQVLAALKPILENPAIKKIGQNIKYDYCVFKNHGINLQGIAYDTMLESYILNSSANRHDMDTLALKYLGHKTISFEDVAGKGAKQLRFDDIPVDKAAPYAAEDADITLQLHQKLFPMMDESLQKVFSEIE